MVEAFPWETTARYVIRDRDRIYGTDFQRRVKTLGLYEVPIAPRSPWQNAYAERFIGSLRRECLDHVIVLNERHLSQILSDYSPRSTPQNRPTVDGSKPANGGRPGRLLV
jgi:transposase InsO family protein